MKGVGAETKKVEENGGISEIHRAQHIKIKLFYNTFFRVGFFFLNSEKDILFIEFLSSSVFSLFMYLCCLIVCGEVVFVANFKH